MFKKENDMRSKVEKCIKILGEDTLKIIATDDCVLLNGNALDLGCLVAKIIVHLIGNGCPKELLKETVDLAFMDEDELDKKLLEQLEEVKGNLEELKEKLEKDNEHTER